MLDLGNAGLFQGGMTLIRFTSPIFGDMSHTPIYLYTKTVLMGGMKYFYHSRSQELILSSNFKPFFLAEYSTSLRNC